MTILEFVDEFLCPAPLQIGYVAQHTLFDQVRLQFVLVIELLIENGMNLDSRAESGYPSARVLLLW